MSAISRRDLLAVGAAVGVGMMPATALAKDQVKRAGGPRLRLGLCAYSYRDHLTGKAAPSMDLLGFVRRAAELDVETVELTSYYFPQEVTPAYLSQLKRECYLNGLAITGVPVGNVFTHPAGKARDGQMALVRKWVDVAAALGAPTVRVFAGVAQPGQSPVDAMRCCIGSLEEACDYAGTRGVILALENHGGIVAEVESVLEIVRAVKSEWFGINFDTGNFHTDDPYADGAKVAPYAVTAHIKTEIVPKGKAKVPADLKRIAMLLRNAGYRGPFSLEYEASEPAATGVPKALAAIRDALQA